MIRAHRQRHRRIFLLLAVVLPSLFVAGLVSRRPVPAHEAPLADQAADSWESMAGVPAADATPARADLFRSTSPTGDLAVRLDLSGLPPRPELLVYWTHRGGDSGSNPLERAVFVGVHRHGSPLLNLPPDAANASGELIVYSLAQQEIVARFELPGPSAEDLP